MELWVLSFTLILTRSAALVMALPLFDAARAPRTVKIGLAFALSVMWFGSFGVHPSALLGSKMPISWLGFAVLVGREAIFGALLGFAFGLFLTPARIAGAYIGQEMGLSMATLSDPQHPGGNNVFGQLLEALSVLIFFALDVHHVLLTAAHAALVRWPIGGPLALNVQPLLTDGLTQAHHWGLLIAAPLGALLFVTIVVLTLLARATPQMNLFSVGLSIRLCVGFCALLMFLPDILGAIALWHQNLAAVLHEALRG